MSLLLVVICLICFLFFYLFFSFCSIISIPGNFFPSSNSSVAPPPVDICVNESLYPKLITALAVSPPPIIVISLFSNILHSSCVPFENSFSSNFPTGPFQIIVLLSSKYVLNSFILPCPMSNPISSSFISLIKHSFTFFGVSIFVDVTTSIGKIIFYLNFLLILKYLHLKWRSNFLFP